LLNSLLVVRILVNTLLQGIEIQQVGGDQLVQQGDADGITFRCAQFGIDKPTMAALLIMVLISVNVMV